MDPFLEACGATGPLQLNVECQGAPRAESVTFDLPFVLIGRDPGADLHFPHQDVSERHVYLQMVAGHLCYMDLGSRMGTILGGKSLRSGWLPRRKSIRVGPYRIGLVGGDSEEVDAGRLAGSSVGFATPPLPDASPPSLALELNHRGIRPALCPIRGDLTLIGSSTDCDVRVLDPSVSNYHCSLLHTAAGVWVVDLLGLGGVTVNGAVVRHARLDDGDALRIGHSLIRLRVEPDRAVTACAVTVPAGLMADPETGMELEPALELGSGLSALDKDELVEALLTPLSERFDLMQQQMFEQLHQVGVVLFERFAVVQEEQVRALQDELEQFRRVTRELDALRSDLTVQSERFDSPTAVAIPTRLGRATAAPGRAVMGHGAIVLARPEANGNGHIHGNGNGNGNGSHRPEPYPNPIAVAPVIQLGSVQYQNQEPEPDQPTTEAIPIPAAAKAADSLATGPERRQDVDIHAWLCQRIAMIQNEQQSRWQKILRMIPGQLLGKPTV